jgi:hypothetical protein
MKKFLSCLLAALALSLPLAWVAPIEAQPLGGPGMYWWFQLRDERNQTISDTSARCFVYTAGTDTLATIYSDRNLTTAAANPIIGAALGSSAGQSCEFFTATSVLSVDVVAWTKRARSRISGYTPAASAGHVLVLDQQMTKKIIQIPLTPAAGSVGTSYVNTGVTIPKGFVVRDALIEVRTAGTGGAHVVAGILETDPKGFCAAGVARVADSATGGVTMANAGWLRCGATFTADTSQNMDAYAASFHVGHLLAYGAIGATASHTGSYFPFPFVGNGTNKTVVYHMGSANGKGCNANCGAGYLYLVGEEMGNDY